MAAKKSAGERIGKASEAQALVHLFRVLTEEQFDFWITSLNRAVVAMGGPGEHYTRDDRQKTISYWYLLMFLLEIYSAKRNPFDVKKGDAWLSDGLSSMEKLASDLGDRYKEETVRRYVFDLKRHGLIAIDGRGPAGMVKLSAPAILALTDTIRQWVSAFRDLHRRFEGLGRL
jgi:hypothetical protein